MEKIIRINRCAVCPNLTTGGVAYECGLLNDGLQYDINDNYLNDLCPLEDVSEGNYAIFNVSNNEVAVCPCTGNSLKHEWCVRCDLFHKCRLAVKQPDC